MAIESRRVCGKQRRGVITLLTVISIPVFLLCLLIAVESNHLVQSKQELKQNLEACAQAAMHVWSRQAENPHGPDTTADEVVESARKAGNEFASLNPVFDQMLSADDLSWEFSYDQASATRTVRLHGEIVIAGVAGGAFGGNESHRLTAQVTVTSGSDQRSPDQW